jgi:mannan endo-1,4-beta-mannosidase
LAWIERAPGGPYFMTDAGAPWTPIGQNDGISWIEWRGLLHRGDLGAVERHLAHLRDSGVTCLRFMLEYAETGEYFFEQPAGTFNRAMVQLWDDLFRLVAAAGLRMLLTPLDTFFNWVRWDLHPYNVANGGPCADRTSLLVCPGVRALIKARLAFATGRWGGSGALFAWDLWNEMHPVQGEDRPGCFEDYIGDVGPFLRNLEQRLHGRAHPQCVSVFGPELHWKPWLNEPVFRHPALDFANNHFYEEGTIDHPQDTVAPALAVGKLVREALAEITDQRPFFDSEHGPIHTFKDHKTVLPEPFDDEYFRHVQWAHLASGGAGGGMRWPNRHPHTLTPGMRRAQRALAGFLPLVDWLRFDRRPIDVEVSDPEMACFACGDARQAVLWLLRTTPLRPDGCVDQDRRSGVSVQVPGLSPGQYWMTTWDTREGGLLDRMSVVANAHGMWTDVPVVGADVAIAIKRA